MGNKALVNRLNRAQGQIEAIKKSLLSVEEKDCLTTIRQLKAAQNALKKFAEAYVAQHLDECMSKSSSSKQLKKGLQEVIQAAFSL